MDSIMFCRLSNLKFNRLLIYSPVATSSDHPYQRDEANPLVRHSL
jgi:hypothetical protein